MFPHPNGYTFYARLHGSLYTRALAGSREERPADRWIVVQADVSHTQLPFTSLNVPHFFPQICLIFLRNQNLVWQSYIEMAILSRSESNESAEELPYSPSELAAGADELLSDLVFCPLCGADDFAHYAADTRLLMIRLHALV